MATGTKTLTLSAPTSSVANRRSRCRSRDEHQLYDRPNLIAGLRLLTFLFIYVAYVNSDVIQHLIDEIWEWLRQQWWYKTVYNETFFVQVWAYPSLFIYRVIHRFRLGQKYRVSSSSAGYQNSSVKEQLLESLEYSFPLVVLDTFHVKSYAGVEHEVLAAKRNDWIQVTRALPESPPLLSDMVRHLVVAIVIYDALFFLQHYTFHKNASLYRLFHIKHHTHKSVNVKVTNQLHMIERIALVLAANAGLKLQGAHPLTRTVFIMVFITLLVDNHSGYDFPWSYHRILPSGLIGGPRKHFEHHEYGNRYYQPIFTYLDRIVEWRSKRRRTDRSTTIIVDSDN